MKKLIVTLLMALVPLVPFAQISADTGGQQQEDKVVIYPNPANEEDIHVKSEDIKSVEVMNIIGRKIFTKKQTDAHARELIIPVDKFDKGLYLVKVTFNNQKTVIQKVLVK